MTVFDSNSSTPTSVSFDDGHKSAAASPVVVPGRATAHKTGEDVDDRILANACGDADAQVLNSILHYASSELHLMLMTETECTI